MVFLQKKKPHNLTISKSPESPESPLHMNPKTLVNFSKYLFVYKVFTILHIVNNFKQTKQSTSDAKKK